MEYHLEKYKEAVAECDKAIATALLCKDPKNKIFKDKTLWMEQISLELAKFGNLAQENLKSLDKQALLDALKNVDKKTLLKIFGVSIFGFSTLYLL